MATLGSTSDGIAGNRGAEGEELLQEALLLRLRMIYTSSLIYNDSVTRFNNTLKQKHFAPLAGLLGFAPREYLQFAPDAPVVCSVQPTPPTQPPTQKEPA